MGREKMVFSPQNYVEEHMLKIPERWVSLKLSINPRLHQELEESRP